MKEIPEGFRTEKEFNPLEKILKVGGINLGMDEIREIIEAYEDYTANATIASQNISYGKSTIIKYWRKVGFEIKKRGGRGKDKGHRDVYEKYKLLLEQGQNQSKIAGELGISRQAVNDYLNANPGLRKIYEEKRKEK